MVADGVPGCVRGSLIRIPPVLTQKIAVLSWCCHPRPAASGKIVGGVAGLETALESVDCGSVHTQGEGDLLWRIPGFKSTDSSATILA